MKKYFDYLDSIPDANELNAPMLIVSEYGIEYRIAVSIVSEWMRIRMERDKHVN